MSAASVASAARGSRWIRPKVLKQRLLTALVLIPLFVWGVLALPTLYFSALRAVVVSIAANELGRLVRLPSTARRVFVAAVAATLLIITLAAPVPPLAHGLAIAAELWWLVAQRRLRRYEAGEPVPHGRWCGALIGLLVLVPPWLALSELHRDPATGPSYVLLLFVLIWVADSGAYFSGRRYGRRKLAPRVSPGKTREGVAGGMAAALVVAVIGARIFDMSFAATGAFMILCGLVVVISVVGDLVESLFKREAGVKDSGRFLPGHGGALDRIDSLTAAAPLFYLGVILIRRFT